jgi:methylase of polypeptide subunit release factors
LKKSRDTLTILKEKLIISAIEDTEFIEHLKDVVSNITKQAKSVENESGIEFHFDHELYGLLKKINFDFVYEKEASIETKRHVGKGRIDSKIGGVVIEYKYYAKLKSTKDVEKATEQLENYLNSISKKNETIFYGFLTDGIKCKEIISQNGTIISKSVLVNFSYVEALRLVKHIVSSYTTALSSKNLIKDFTNPALGDISNSFSKKLFSILINNQTPKTKMLQAEWEQLFKLGHNDKSQQQRIEERKKALEEVIGEKLKTSSEQYLALFSLQTTYAIILKMISFRIISEKKFSKPLQSYNSVLRSDDLGLCSFCQKLEDGAIFRDLGIMNLLEGDFFSWYADQNQWDSSIADLIRKTLQILGRYENTSTVFKSEDSLDIFKNLYQNIMPKSVRSSLGEFYTPEWLAEHVFQSVKPKNKTWRGLDPCTGSGTFILTMIKRVLEETKNETKDCQLNEVLRRIHGFDINPLAVLTSRINYFIKIAHLIPMNSSHLQIPIYLGDASYIPEKILLDDVDCLKYTIKSLKYPIEIIIPNSIAKNSQEFSELMFNFEKKIKAQDVSGGIELFLKKIPKSESKSIICKNIEKLVNDLVELERRNWNGIWARIIANFLTTVNLGKFDIIVGNPPWIDWKNLPSGYREKIKSLCIDKQIFSGDGMTGGINLNICALITNVVMDNALTEKGELAFLMPKGIAFQQSYEGFRQFRSGEVQRTFLSFHDWTKFGKVFDSVTEKFMTYVIGYEKNRPETIPVLRHEKKKNIVKKSGKKSSDIWKQERVNYDSAMENIVSKKMHAGQIMPHNTAFTFFENLDDIEKIKKISGECSYVGREGIEFYPQEIFLLKKPELEPASPSKNCVYIQNFQSTTSKYIIPEDIVELEKTFLFPLVKGKNIVKFGLKPSDLVVPFPYKKSNIKKPCDKIILSKESPKLLQYFLNHQSNIKAQTNFSDKIRGPNSGEFYGLARVGKYSFADYYVAFRDNTKWGAAVISKSKTFWNENKRMLFQNHAVSICEDSQGNFISEDEAHYICSILNAPIVEKYIMNSSDERTFKIRVPIKIPKFDSKSKIHLKLSELSKNAHKNSDEIEKILPQLDELYLKIL